MMRSSFRLLLLLLSENSLPWEPLLSYQFLLLQRAKYVHADKQKRPAGWEEHHVSSYRFIRSMRAYSGKCFTVENTLLAMCGRWPYITWCRASCVFQVFELVLISYMRVQRMIVWIIERLSFVSSWWERDKQKSDKILGAFRTKSPIVESRRYQCRSLHFSATYNFSWAR